MALLAVAFASNSAMIVIASVFVGAAATVAQQIVPFAPHLANPTKPGATGVIAAPIAGRVADRRGPAVVVRLGAIISILSWPLFGISPTIIGLIIGVVALDFGMQSALVSNQSLVYC